MNGQELYAMFAEELTRCAGKRPTQWWFIPQPERRAWDALADKLLVDVSGSNLYGDSHG